MELYDSDLTCLAAVLQSLEDVSRIDGVFSVEIRVKVDDVTPWAVIGWGEAGDPAVLRFEEDPSPPPLNPKIHVGGTVLPFTINESKVYRSADEIDD